MPEARLTESLIRLLIAIGGVITGVATTVVGSWISSKIHVYHEQRAAHHEDLRQRVLIPLRDGLTTHFQPLLTQQRPMITIEHAAREYSEMARVTEEPSTWGPVMGAPFPGNLVFGPLPSALLEDARKNHHGKLMKNVDTFVSGFMGYAGELHLWVSRIAKEILTASGLPSFPTPKQGPYVMHYRLAAFVYQRHFRFETGALYTEEDGLHRVLKGGSYTLAVGSADQITALVKHLNRLIDSEAASATSLREKMGALQSQFNDLMGAIEFAIASRRLHERCDLVSFF